MKKIVPGFWYHYDNKKKKYPINTTNIYKTSECLKRLKIVNEAYIFFLKELAICLNNLHNLSWKDTSWEVIIGPWLQKYLSVVHDRLTIVNNNLKKNNFFFFFNKNKKKRRCLNTYDLTEFGYQSSSDSWNEEIFSRILNYELNKDNKYLFFNKDFFFYQNKNYFLYNLKTKALNFLIKIYVKIFCKKTKIIFSRPFLGSKKKLISLLFLLKEFPYFYVLDDKKINVEYDSKLRKNLNLPLDKNEYYKVASILLKECLPRIYLEGFKKVLCKINESSLPKHKMVIFTSNIHNDSIFKFWVAQQKNIGSKIVIAQHGGGYNMFKFDEKRDYELSICDKYLSWGWTNKKYKKKIISFSILNHNIFPQNYNRKSEFISIVMNNYKNYISSADVYNMVDLFKSDKNKNYRELNEIYGFLNKIDNKIKRKIILRPHPLKVRNHTTSNFEKKIKHTIKIEDPSQSSIIDFLKKFKLNFISGPYATTFSHAMANNFPTVTIFPHDINHLNTITKKVVKKLIRAKICHKNHLSLEKFIKKNYNDISKWWSLQKTQSARKYFCRIHANVIEKDKIYFLLKILNKEKKFL